METKTFPGRFENLAKIADFVMQAAKSAGLDESAVYAVQLAVDEACSNIIEHGYGGEGRGDIECSVEILPQGLQVTLRDTARPFTPEKVRAPNLTVPLEQLEARGLGIYLMRKMMDEVHYKYNGQGNVLTLVKQKHA